MGPRGVDVNFLAIEKFGGMGVLVQVVTASAAAVGVMGGRQGLGCPRYYCCKAFGVKVAYCHWPVRGLVGDWGRRPGWIENGIRG